MAKLKLNLQQKKRILQQQQAYCEQVEVTSNLQKGLVIAHYGNKVEIEADAGKIIECSFRQHLGGVVVGDEVIWQLQPNEKEGVILSFLPRRSVLCRPDKYGKLKPIAANIDNMIIVVAAYPEFSEYVIDRYLVAAELMNVRATVVLNKIDRYGVEELKQALLRLLPYQQLNYQVITASSYNQQGKSQLLEVLAETTSIFIGPSGVGKSSLVQWVSGQSLRIGEVSQVLNQGTHTTTAARLYHLPNGGKLIDSPGIREFGLWHINPEELLKGFCELQALARQCKFRNCQHQKELSCAIQTAIQKETINPLRLASYQRILATLN